MANIEVLGKKKTGDVFSENEHKNKENNRLTFISESIYTKSLKIILSPSRPTLLKFPAGVYCHLFYNTHTPTALQMFLPVQI